MPIYPGHSLLGPHPYSYGTGIAQAAQAGQQRPNPVANTNAPSAVGATSGGIDQAAANMGLPPQSPQAAPGVQAPTPGGPQQYQAQAKMARHRAIYALAAKFANAPGAGMPGAPLTAKPAVGAITPTATGSTGTGSGPLKPFSATAGGGAAAVGSMGSKMAFNMSPPPPGQPAGTPPPPAAGLPGVTPPPGAVLPPPSQMPQAAPPPPGQPPGQPMMQPAGPPPVQPNPQADVNPPRPRTSQDAARDAVLLRIMEQQAQPASPVTGSATDNLVADVKSGADKIAGFADLLRGARRLPVARLATPLAQAAKVEGRALPAALPAVTAAPAASAAAVSPQLFAKNKAFGEFMGLAPDKAYLAAQQNALRHGLTAQQAETVASQVHAHVSQYGTHPSLVTARTAARPQGMAPSASSRANLFDETLANTFNASSHVAPAEAAARQAQAVERGILPKTSADVRRSFAADKIADDDVFAQEMSGNPHMRGWQWKALQREQDIAQKKWMPRIFKTEATPLMELLASPGRQGILKGLLGGAVGGGLGALTGEPLGVGIGAGAGALIGGIHGYGARRAENDRIMDALRRSPPGATVGDYNLIQQMDRQKHAMDDWYACGGDETRFHEILEQKRRRALARSKEGAQDNAQPQRSATGESKGLRFAHDPDDYAQGQAAWASLTSKFKGGRELKESPNPFLGKHASALSPLARGFLRACLERDLSPAQIKEAVARVDAEKFGADVKAELAQALEKTAFLPLLAGAARAALPAIGRGAAGLFNFLRPAAAAVPAAARAAAPVAQAAAPAARSMLSRVGGAAGRFYTGGAVGNILSGQHSDLPLDAQGRPIQPEIGGSPLLGRIAHTFNPLNWGTGALAGGLTHGALGGMSRLQAPLRQAVSGTLAGNAIDTIEGNPEPTWARLGAGAGLATGATHNALTSAANRAAAQGVTNHWTAPVLQSMATAGRHINTAGIAAPLITGGIGALHSGVQNYIGNSVDRATARALPVAMDYAQDRTNQYLNQLGVRNPQTGRVDPGHVLGRAFAGALDGLGGLLTGHSLMAGMGAMAAGAGAPLHGPWWSRQPAPGQQ